MSPCLPYPFQECSSEEKVSLIDRISADMDIRVSLSFSFGLGQLGAGEWPVGRGAQRAGSNLIGQGPLHKLNGPG